jgi:cell division protein FtsB
MDVNVTTITIGSILAIIGVVLAVVSFFNNNKKEIQARTTEYAIYKQKVESLEQTVADLKQDVKDQGKELRDDVKRLDELLIKKIDNVYKSVGELKDLLIEKLNINGNH